MARSKPRRRPIAVARPPKAVLAPVSRPGARLPEGEPGTRRVLVVGWANGTSPRIPKDFTGDGWRVVRFDCDPASKPDLLGALENWSGIPDGSLDAIWIPQLLQRLPQHTALHILKECRRVLTEGGVLAVTVPNGQLAASYVATGQAEIPLYDTPVGAIAPVDLLFGLRVGQRKGEAQHFHRSVWGVETLGLSLRDTGLSNIRVDPRGYEITAIARAWSFDHPERVERVVMTKLDMKQPVVTAPPVAENAAITAARPRVAPGGSLADELDLEPVVWTPLGLKK